jgi:uncharacterized protein (TIGR02271 family)
MATPNQPESSGRSHTAAGERGPTGTGEAPREPAVVREPSWAGGPRDETGARDADTEWDTHSSEQVAASAEAAAADQERTLELREEQLVAHKELRELGEVEVRTEVDEVPGRLEVEAYREEVQIDHEPVGTVVSERDDPWEEDGVLVVPVYEEQLVVTRRLVLRERLRIRRVGTTERQLFQDTLRRERLVIEDPQHTGLVHERYPTDESAGSPATEEETHTGTRAEGGLLEHLVRKVLE